MHPITFGIKRTFQGSLRILRPWFAQFRLTPARFDLLCAINHRNRGCLLQSELRALLGVTASTISRMVDSLEELGFLFRTVSLIDRRERVVTLTDIGRRALRDAVEATVPHVAQLIVDSAFVLPWDPRRELPSADLSLLERLFARAREQFRDRAVLVFPSG